MKPIHSILLLTILINACNVSAQPANRPSADNAQIPEGTRVLKNIEYIPQGHERQKLDLYVPSSAGKPLPLIIWVHGGAWMGGSKDNCPAIRFLNRGYAVASVNYRLSQHALFPAQIEDCKAAVRWLRTHAKEHNLDPKRFGAWGSSAGGHLVALLGTTGDSNEFNGGSDVSSQVQAVADFFGPTDLLRMEEQAGPNSRMRHNTPDSPESKLVGGAVQENKEKATRANPIVYVSKADPPMLIVNGDADPLVPHQQSELLYEALTKAGVSAKLHIVKGGGHGNGFGPDVDRMVEQFFKEQLKP